MVKRMAPKPLILALANPNPEIMPDEVKAVRDDAVIATGRSDYPNQVNNVLCFPFIFRGALDVGATTITEEMKLAAVRAIADLAQVEQSEIVRAAYGEQPMSFGPEYLIPKPFDPRLIVKIAPAVAQAAMDSGVATRPIEDFEAYRQQLNNLVWISGLVMKPVFAEAKRNPKRIIYAEGEDERVLSAVRNVVDEGMARPILIGRRDVVLGRIQKLGLRLRPEIDFELVTPENDPRYKELWTTYHALTERKGISVDYAKMEARRRTTLIGALMVRLGYADGLICGTFGNFARHLHFVRNVLGLKEGLRNFYAMNLLNLPGRTLMLCDTYVNYDPTAEQVVEMTVLAAEEARRFGIEPRIALLSHSNFGSDNTVTSDKMRRALEILHSDYPELEVEGEMHGDAALDIDIRTRIFPNSRLRDEANLLIFPTLDAANISYNLLKTAAGEGMTIGPILLGAKQPVHILTPTATVRRIVNMTALTVVEASQIR